MAENKELNTQVEEVKSTEETQTEEVKSVEEPKVEEPKVETKTFTQEEVDAIVQARLAKEKEKVKTEKERLAELEEWKKEQELKAKIEKENRIENNKNKFDSIVKELINEMHVEDIKTMLISKINFEDFNEAEARGLVKEKINSIPGIGKERVNVTTAKIEEASVNNDPEETQQIEEEPKYFLNGVEITEEQFKTLTPIMKSRVQIK